MPEDSHKIALQTEAIIETDKKDFELILRHKAFHLADQQRLDEASKTIREIQLLTHLSKPV